jgi:hypothetical protein
VSPALDPALLATLDALLDRLLPGAAAAGVGGYIEQALAGACHDDVDAYVEGLAALEQRGLAALSPGEQDEVVASGLDGPFLQLVRRHLIEGMFGDPRWGGNADGRGWELLGYSGPRREWSADDQRVEVLR